MTIEFTSAFQNIFNRSRFNADIEQL